MTEEDYQSRILAWRAKMESSLRAEDSWLALAGLFWLEEGANPVGSGPTNVVVLPSRLAPPALGTFHLEGGEVTLHVRPASEVTLDGQTIERARLEPDTAEAPSLVRLGPLTMVLIRRGERLGVRVWDNSRAERLAFPGRLWFPIQPGFRIAAAYALYEPPKRIRISNVLGTEEEMPAIGSLAFVIEGHRCALDALDDGDGRLFILFRDATNGDETYPGGRFLLAHAAAGGEVLLDFNKAYNPPCAFTPFATCPIPPVQNDLRLRLPAGERFRPRPG